eukprot:7005828-Karenia_brevis.AAC.1
MPHSGHSDDDVDEMYGLLENQCAEAKQRKYLITLAGDFNAEVGTCSEYDDPEVIGPMSMRRRSDRGT